MMKLSELMEKARELLPGDSVKVACEIWFWNPSSTGDYEMTFTIYSVKLQKHYRGRTPEEALAELAGQRPTPAIDDVEV